MRRIAVTLEYDGTEFHGWQVQAEGRTVQAAVEAALQRATGSFSRVTGAGRTDSGVHAEGQVGHFDTDSDLSEGRLLKALNHWLPDDVAVLDCRGVPEQFDARFSASSKLYRYRILRSAVRRPLRERRVLRIWRPLDLAAMRRCAGLLEGEHDFTSFASVHAETDDKVRRLLRSELAEDEDELHYLVEGDGFLYNMVRVIVGTLIEVGLGNVSPARFARILESRDRKAAGPTAAAAGLCLVRVNYPGELLPPADARARSMPPSR